MLAENNRLTPVEALNLFTRGAAWFTDAEAELGRIAPGYLADFALLDRDYLKVSENQIRSIISVMTVMDGRVVFGAENFRPFAPPLPEILPEWSSIRYYWGYHGAR